MCRIKLQCRARAHLTTGYASTLGEEGRRVTVRVPALALVDAAADAEAHVLVVVLDATGDRLGRKLLDVLREGGAVAELAVVLLQRLDHRGAVVCTPSRVNL